MKITHLGAIDIGSNAARLLINHVVESHESDKPFFKKAELIRVPLRLGFDAFENHKLGESAIERLTHTMHAFKHLMKAYEVEHYLTYATAALRDVVNSDQIIDDIFEKTGIKIEVIGGKKEAEILNATEVNSKLEANKTYVFIDVGGGSTELTIIKNNKTLASRSFHIGTIRLLKESVSLAEWHKMDSWIHENLEDTDQAIAIGTGGNINKIFKMTGKKEGEPVSFKKLKQMHNEIKALTIEERIRLLNMNPDRADVLPHATRIYIHVMEEVKADKILIPKMGLVDGMMQILYSQLKNNNQLSFF